MTRADAPAARAAGLAVRTGPGGCERAADPEPAHAPCGSTGSTAATTATASPAPSTAIDDWLARPAAAPSDAAVPDLRLRRPGERHLLRRAPHRQPVPGPRAATVRTRPPPAHGRRADGGEPARRAAHLGDVAARRRGRQRRRHRSERACSRRGTLPVRRRTSSPRRSALRSCWPAAAHDAASGSQPRSSGATDAVLFAQLTALTGSVTRRAARRRRAHPRPAPRLRRHQSTSPLPATVWRFAPGDRIELTLRTTDSQFLGSTTPPRSA